MGTIPGPARRITDRVLSAAASGAMALVMIQHAASQHPLQLTIRPRAR